MNMIDDRENDLAPLYDLEKDFQREILDLKDKLDEKLSKSLKKLSSLYDLRTPVILKPLFENLNYFNNPNIRIDNHNKQLLDVEEKIQLFTTNSKSTKTIMGPIRTSADDLINLYEQYLVRIDEQLEYLFNQILNSDFGDKKFGKPFEKLVLTFIDMLYLHDLKRKQENVNGIVFDGFYEKFDHFNAIEKTGFYFDNIIVEVKNKKPKPNDFMQCFKYTLFFQDTIFTKVPLTLLICRFKPTDQSSIWGLMQKAFSNSIRNEVRLIVLLDINDLEQMKIKKINREDPSVIIKDRILNNFSRNIRN